MEKIVKRKINLVAVIAAAIIIILCMPLSVSAGSTSSYKKITVTPVKAGNYYYKIKTNSKGYSTGIILRSKHKKSGYKKILSNCYDNAFTNGKYIYTHKYSESKERDQLVRYNAAGKKRKVLKTLPSFKAEVYWWDFGTVSGKYIFLTRSEMDSAKIYTYRYNTSSKKLTKVKTNCGLITQTNGGYALGIYYIDTSGIEANRLDLYKISSKGKISRVKKLGECCEGEFIGNKIYYVKFISDYSDDYSDIMVTAKIYSCGRNGKNQKLLGSITAPYNNDNVDDFSGLHAEKITSSYCKFSIGCYHYRFNYSRGKFTKL